MVSERSYRSSSTPPVHAKTHEAVIARSIRSVRTTTTRTWNMYRGRGDFFRSAQDRLRLPACMHGVGTRQGVDDAGRGWLVHPGEVSWTRSLTVCLVGELHRDGRRLIAAAGRLVIVG